MPRPSLNLSIARRFVRRCCVLGMIGMGAALLGGCAGAPAAHDPLEPFNRSMFEFNDAVDRHVLKPVATGYEQLTPSLFRQGVSNFFGNLDDVWSGVNNALQLKPRPAADSLMRVLINSTVGLLGVLDVATKAGIERHPEDFGQTLGYWGMGSGPYLVLPLLGPSTLRDTAALAADFRGDLVMIQDDVAFRNSAYALRGVNRRAKLLRAGNMLEEAAFDKYTFVRDAFLQRRRYEVLDGNVPDTPDEDPNTAPKADAQSQSSQPKE